MATCNESRSSRGQPAGIRTPVSRPFQADADGLERPSYCHAILLALLAAVTLCGCQPFDYYDHTLKQLPPPQLEPPREMSKVSLPAYQIEPPDLLQIDVLKLVPLPPYRLESYDVLQVQVMGTLLDQPVDGYYLIEAEGIINLGPAYGTVRVAGMTIEEAKAAVTNQLLHTLREPQVSVQLARTSGTQQISGVYLVGPDGTVNLKQYGTVHVAGKTMLEARLALQKQLSQFFDSPEVAVDVLAYNSKVYYVVTEGANLGDNIKRLPITGKETVLDAISNTGGLSQLSRKEIWIARPAPAGFGCEQILPVDYDAITRGGVAATNYQLLPGDRVFIAENRTVAFTNLITKLTSPVERVAGTASLGGSTIRAMQTLGRNFNNRNN
jgi:polysaccharide biosynthesis/export protein